MKYTLLIGVLTSVAALATLVVILLYRHKKAGAGDIKLIGELAQVHTALDPEGTVIVRGELWRAKSKDGTHISTRGRVRVVGFEDYLAIVEPCDSVSKT